MTHRALADLHVEEAERLLRLGVDDPKLLRKAHIHVLLAGYWERRASRAERQEDRREKGLRTRIYNAVSGYHRSGLSPDYRAGLAKAAEIVLDTD